MASSGRLSSTPPSQGSPSVPAAPMSNIPPHRASTHAHKAPPDRTTRHPLCPGGSWCRGPALPLSGQASPTHLSNPVSASVKGVVRARCLGRCLQRQAPQTTIDCPQRQRRTAGRTQQGGPASSRQGRERGWGEGHRAPRICSNSTRNSSR